jgi:hypothetical protein
MNIRAKLKQDMKIYRVTKGIAPLYELTETLLKTVKCLYNQQGESKKYLDTGEVLIIDGRVHIEVTSILTTDVVEIDGIKYEVIDIKDPNSLGKEYLINLKVRE